MPMIAIYAIVAFVLYAAGAASGYKVESWHRDALDLKAEKISELQIAAETKKAADASAALEQQKEQLNARQQIVTRTITKIVARPVYSQQCFDADGLLAANSALQGSAPAPGGPDPALPDAKPAAGRHGIVNPAKNRGSLRSLL